MATLTLTYPDAVQARVVDALCAEGGYDQLPDPKPTRGAFAKSRIVRFVKEAVVAYEANKAAETALAAARTTATTEVTIS